MEDSRDHGPDWSSPTSTKKQKGDCPTLPELKNVMRNEVNIILRWYDIGLELLEDRNGGILDLIKDDSKNDAEECCTNMFKTWLNRTPNSSWSQLIVALEKIKMNTAAEFVRRYSNGESFPMPDINQAMNILPYIQEKWQLIGRNLGVSIKNLDSICREAHEQEIPQESSNTFCCAKMLTYWIHSGSSNVSADTIIEVVSALHVGLTKEKVSRIKAALDSSNVTKEYATSPPEGHEKSREYATSPPEGHEKSYVEMKTNVCKELIKSNFSIGDVVLYLEMADVNPNVFKDISSFPNLFKSLENHNHMNKADLCWLKDIAKHMECEKALEIIENYENSLLADKTNWGNILNTTNNGFLAVSNKSLENCTIKDCSNAKLIGSEILGLNETDSILEATGVGSMIFYWRVKENINITLPEVVDSSLMRSCKDAGITHIGTIIDGNLQLRIIDKLKVQAEFTVVFTGSTGTGKSEACNFFMQKQVFKAKRGFFPVSKETESGVATIGGKLIELVDTPGFLDPSSVEEDDERLRFARGLINMKCGFHMLGLVLNITKRVEKGEDKILKNLLSTYEHCLPYVVLIFTHGIGIGDTGDEQETVLEGMIKEIKGQETSSLNQVLKKINHRYIILESVNPMEEGYHAKKSKQLVEMIDTVFKQTRRPATNEFALSIAENLNKEKIDQVALEKELADIIKVAQDMMRDNAEENNDNFFSYLKYAIMAIGTGILAKLVPKNKYYHEKCTYQ